MRFDPVSYAMGRKAGGGGGGELEVKSTRVDASAQTVYFDEIRTFEEIVSFFFISSRGEVLRYAAFMMDQPTDGGRAILFNPNGRAAEFYLTFEDNVPCMVLIDGDWQPEIGGLKYTIEA